MTNFDDLFSNYKLIEEPLDTLFTIIVHNLTIDKVIEFVNHRLQITKDLRQSKKKTQIFQRLNNFKDHLTLLEEIGLINAIFLIDETIRTIPLQQEWIDILNSYDIDKFIFKYQTTFAIDYLKTLLTDQTYYNVIYVRNNEYIHTHLNPTKKKIAFQKESKSFDITEYIQKNIPIGNKCLIHGVSSNLKYLKCDPHWVFARKLEDEEILSIYQKDAISVIHEQLDKYFGFLNLSKQLHRLIFGKDIQIQLSQRTLNYLYLSSDIYDKVIKKIPPDYITSSLNIIKVESLSKGDTGDRLRTDFAGAIGITYY